MELDEVNQKNVSQSSTDLTKYINENFGANATYVEGLLARYKADPNTVDESWRIFFSDLISGKNGSTGDAAPAKETKAASTPDTAARSGRQTRSGSRV